MKNNEMTLVDLFTQQMFNQEVMIDKGMYEGYKLESTSSVPVDDVHLASYHIQHLISEVGEVLDADKRWKNFRNEKYDKQNKAEEIADCFIVLMNVAMYSDINAYELQDVIKAKLDKVSSRIESK